MAAKHGDGDVQRRRRRPRVAATRRIGFYYSGDEVRRGVPQAHRAVLARGDEERSFARVRRATIPHAGGVSEGDETRGDDRGGVPRV